MVLYISTTFDRTMKLRPISRCRSGNDARYRSNPFLCRRKASQGEESVGVYSRDFRLLAPWAATALIDDVPGLRSSSRVRIRRLPMTQNSDFVIKVTPRDLCIPDAQRRVLFQRRIHQRRIPEAHGQRRVLSPKAHHQRRPPKAHGQRRVLTKGAHQRRTTKGAH